MKRLIVLNTDSKEFSYGGVAPIMRNMHAYLCKQFEVKYIYLPQSWKKGSMSRFKYLLYLLIHFNTLKKCDYILSHSPEGSFIASFTGVRYTHIYHGNSNPMEVSKYWFGKYFKIIYKLFFKRISRTASLKYTVGPVWGDVKKLYNPISHEVLPTDIKTRSGLVFAGRLEKMKNVDRLISIYSKLPQNILESNDFFIAGYGTQSETLMQLAERLNLRNKIHFLGNLHNSELIKIESSKKLLIMASDYEGLPTAIAEAFSLGIPVVSNCAGDISLVLKNHFNGSLLPMDASDEDYVNAIEEAFQHYQEYSQHALETSKVFSSEKITNEIIRDILLILKNDND